MSNELAIAPSEYCGDLKREGDNHTYTVRVPFKGFENDPTAFAKMAEIAFSHNGPGVRNVLLTCPRGAAAGTGIRRLADFLRGKDCQVTVMEKEDSEFVEAAPAWEVGCMDRRLNDGAATADRARIAFPGGIVVLSSELASVRGLDVFRNHFEAMTREVVSGGGKIGKIRAHMGFGGEAGCGMMALARNMAEVEGQAGLAKKLTDPAAVLEILEELRTGLQRQGLVGTDCPISIQLIDQKGGVSILHTDRDADRASYLASAREITV